MASEKRHIGLFGVAGVLVAALIIAGFVFAGNLFVSGTGVLTIEITDKPANLEKLMLEIDEVSIQGEDGKWIDLNLNLDEPFDLLSLQDGVTATLSVTEIPEGRYKMIKIYADPEVDAYYVVPPDGVSNPVSLKLPSSVLRVVLEPAIDIAYGGEETLTIDLQPEFGEIGVSDSFNLRPVVKSVVS